ncbi:MAG: hypothetical protein JRJ84_18680, partial [Deltaproteobacteria bacterium]|nr:hypothetical protein [Deltaproteobacteria bacterium]
MDIWIVGLGINGVDQVTRETERVLHASKEVLYADAGVGTRAYLEQMCPRVTDLFSDSYCEQRPRLNTYHHIAARVVEAALRHRPVTFAIHGHPLVFSYPPFLIADLARVLGMKVRIQPGISATAALLCDLEVDPGLFGMQMYEATELLVRRRPLVPDVPALIWQIGDVETRLRSMRPSRPERFDRIRDHLLQFYPADHPVVAVYSSPHPLMRSTRLDFPLGRIGDYAAQLHIGYTL